MGRDDKPEEAIQHEGISILAPRVGRDVLRAGKQAIDGISILAPRVGRDAKHGDIGRYFAISILAPRVGRDAKNNGYIKAADIISILAPRVGRDIISSDKFESKGKFQSSRPVWGATNMLCGFIERKLFQSSRPVWGATLICEISLTAAGK